MYPVDLKHYALRLTAWRQAEPSQRRIVRSRHRGRPCVEHWSYGVLRARCVDVGSGMRELWADKGIPVRRYDQGRIAFKTWDEADRVYGEGR